MPVCSAENIYFPSWKTGELCHHEKGHAKPDLPAVRGSPCSAVTAVAASGNSKCRACSNRTMHSKAGLGSHAENRIYSGEFTQRGSSSCYNWHTGVKCSGTWPAEKSLQKETLPWLNGRNAGPCIKVASRGLQRLLWRNGWGDLKMKAMHSSSDLGWWTSPWKTKVLQQPIPSHRWEACWKSISTTLADRESKGRSWEVTGWQNKFKAFQQWRQNWFLPLLGSGIEIAAEVFVTWKPEAGQRLLLMHRVYVGSRVDWRCCCIHRKTVFGLGSYQLWSDQRLGEHIMQSALHAFTLLSYSSPGTCLWPLSNTGQERPLVRSSTVILVSRCTAMGVQECGEPRHLSLWLLLLMLPMAPHFISASS